MSLESGKEFIRHVFIICMEKILKEKLELKLDMIQQGVWKTEDYLIKTLGITEMNRSELHEIKFCLGLLNEKIDKIDAELRGLRSNGTG